jgi:hypothetical protein
MVFWAKDLLAVSAPIKTRVETGIPVHHKNKPGKFPPPVLPRHCSTSTGGNPISKNMENITGVRLDVE